jgi:hypothetical protein
VLARWSQTKVADCELVLEEHARPARA